MTAYSKKGKRFVSLIRADIPTMDETITREQIKARHFVHNTDIGSLGLSPSMIEANGVTLRCDYPFYERNTFCLNVDGSEWSAYKQIAKPITFKMSYILQIDDAKRSDRCMLEDHETTDGTRFKSRSKAFVYIKRSTVLSQTDGSQ